MLNEVFFAICDPSFTWDCVQMVLVSFCESTHDPTEVGLAGERGLLQVHPIHIPEIEEMGFTWDDMYRPIPNTRFSHDYLFSTFGLAPWAGSEYCWGDR